jgi:tetratricopeptide (TPR) repeat protein
MTSPAPEPSLLRRLVEQLNGGRSADAEREVRAQLARLPQSGLLWKLLAQSLWAQGKDPLPPLQQAASLLPDDAELHTNLGNALRARGQADAATASHRRALALRPEYAEAHNNLGAALLDMGRTAEAAECFRRAVAFERGLVAAHANLGNALRLLARLDEALESFRRALALQPGRLDLLNQLSSILCDLGQYEEAAASCRRALELRPQWAEMHSNLGMVLMLHNRAAEAEASCRAALEINPKLTGAMVLLAELHAARGEFAQAEQQLHAALAIDRDLPDAWAALARWRRMTRADGAWLAEAQRVAALRLAPRREVRLQYALGKYFDDIGDFAQAFGHFRRANELTRSFNARHDRARHTHYVEQAMHRYHAGWLRDARDLGQLSQRPVFIVGMWRSGTTLAEQILASHPAAVGWGERAFWSAAAERYEAAGNSHRSLAELSRAYLTHLETYSATALRVVDKMASNFLHLGLIHAALPHARIIHMRRDPLDTCLSMYFQDFLYGHSYANDLEDLAHYYREYLRIMQHWREMLPRGAMLEVPYEQLTADPAGTTRALLDFIGLEWDARCLDFGRTERIVMTRSSWQVRQPVSQSSVGRWRHYQAFIAPLLDATDLRAAADHS